MSANIVMQDLPLLRALNIISRLTLRYVCLRAAGVYVEQTTSHDLYCSILTPVAHLSCIYSIVIYLCTSNTVIHYNKYVLVKCMSLTPFSTGAINTLYHSKHIFSIAGKAICLW